jgi:hypothetical protein
MAWFETLMWIYIGHTLRIDQNEGSSYNAKKRIQGRQQHDRGRLRKSSVADWCQKASTAIGFIKASETLRRNLHITLKKPQFHYKCIEKASTPLKMYLKSLAILEKASISLEKSSKIIEIVIKAHISTKKPQFL